MSSVVELPELSSGTLGPAGVFDASPATPTDGTLPTEFTLGPFVVTELSFDEIFALLSVSILL